jgi:PAS domain S-box-containing protein
MRGIIASPGKKRLRIKLARPAVKNAGTTESITGAGSVEARLRDSEERYRSLFEATFDAIVIHENGLVLEINPIVEKMFGYSHDEIVGRQVSLLIAPECHGVVAEKIRTSFQLPYETTARRKDGTRLDVEIVGKEHMYRGSRVRVAAFRDITVHKNSENALKAINDRLEVEQTALREKNVALKELMNQIDSEKNLIKMQIQSNIDRIAIPILRTLQERLASQEKDYLSLLQDCLMDIASPLIRQLESRFVGLTPREIEICNMVKNGLHSKDIARALNTSVLTVLKQRKNIRKKLGIANRGANLTTYLQSL